MDNTDAKLNCPYEIGVRALIAQLPLDRREDARRAVEEIRREAEGDGARVSARAR